MINLFFCSLLTWLVTFDQQQMFFRYPSPLLKVGEGITSCLLGDVIEIVHLKSHLIQSTMLSSSLLELGHHTLISVPFLYSDVSFYSF